MSTVDAITFLVTGRIGMSSKTSFPALAEVRVVLLGALLLIAERVLISFRTPMTGNLREDIFVQSRLELLYKSLIVIELLVQPNKSRSNHKN